MKQLVETKNNTNHNLENNTEVNVNSNEEEIKSNIVYFKEYLEQAQEYGQKNIYLPLNDFVTYLNTLYIIDKSNIKVFK